MPEIVMPRLSDSMEEGTVLKWLKADGEAVQRGDELVEIETDKATMTYESDQQGVLEIVAHEGDTLPIGAVIARVDGVQAPDAAPALKQAAGSSAVGSPAPVSTSAGPTSTATISSARHDAAGEALGVAASPAAPPSDGAARVKASPVARRIARERGVDLQALRGTGPGGRIVRADVEAAVLAPAATPARPSAPAPPSAPAEPPASAPAPGKIDVATAKGAVTIQELTRTQQAIARRMAESKATIPTFELRSEIDMERCVDLREQLKTLAGDAPAPSYNDMVVRACALALREYPRANGSYRDGRFELYARVNVGIAVAAHDALIVPTIFDADIKSLDAIAAEARALAERVRSGAITPPELSGATFTVSNLGMYGVTNFTAVINPPQAAILAVGAMIPRPVVRDRDVVVRRTMGVTLACDHRILYGADAAQFLTRIRERLEQPAALLL